MFLFWYHIFKKWPSLRQAFSGSAGKVSVSQVGMHPLIMAERAAVASSLFPDTGSAMASKGFKLGG